VLAEHSFLDSKRQVEQKDEIGAFEARPSLLAIASTNRMTYHKAMEIWYRSVRFTFSCMRTESSADASPIHTFVLDHDIAPTVRDIPPKREFLAAMRASERQDAQDLERDVAPTMRDSPLKREFLAAMRASERQDAQNPESNETANTGRDATSPDDAANGQDYDISQLFIRDRKTVVYELPKSLV